MTARGKHVPTVKMLPLDSAHPCHSFQERDPPHRLTSTWLAVSLLATFLVGATLASPAAPTTTRYRTSPLLFHRYLREAFTSGQDVGANVRAVVQTTGDHSFDSLLVHSRRKDKAFRQQFVAWKAWEAKDYAQAVQLYAKAAQQFLQEDAHSEVAFTLYYIAEIYTEQQNFSEGLRWLNRALEVVDSVNCPYLEALIFQSQGYSFWFLDQLQASVRTFSFALERWNQIDYGPGITASWGNLASLYEELRLWNRAQRGYEEALRSSNNSTDAEIRFYLHANYAQFLHGRQDTSRALDHLNEARKLRQVSSEEFRILECQIAGWEGCAQEIISFHPSLPTLRVEKALLLARYFRSRGDSSRSHSYFNQALVESQRQDLPHLARKTALEFGLLLEANGQYERAAHLYSQTLNEQENLFVPEFALPYSRTASPLFDGWIRCLIRLRRQEEAWQQIQRWAWLRREKAKRFRESKLRIERIADELQQFGAAGKLETGSALVRRWEDLPRTNWPIPEGFTILEMWPDKERIFVWVIRSSGRVFRELHLTSDVSTSITAVVEPLFQTTNSLPTVPPPHHLQELYADLFRPVQDLLTSRAVLFIGHRELQNLPLEMLQNEKGTHLLDLYEISYLPSVHYLTFQERRVLGEPLFLAPDSFPALHQVRREEHLFRSLFPNLQVIRAMEMEEPVDAQWIHVSTHFRLDDRFWWASGFGHGRGEINLFQFLRNPLSTPLLSLGVCNAANSYASDSPYWLGLSELFLTQGVGAMVVSRWRMDELSSPIYGDFYARCKQGIPMDQALSQARRSFFGKTLRRSGNRVRGKHPFFWAGITYVGPPGKRLYESSSSPQTLLLFCLSFWLLGLVAIIVKTTRARLDKN